MTASHPLPAPCSLCGEGHAPAEPCPTVRPPSAEPGSEQPTFLMAPADETISSPGADPLLGAQVGSYRLERLLGRGGMGAVYLGVHPLIGSKVAVKFLHESLCSSPVLIKRFFSEARATNQIRSEHVVQVLDLGRLASGRHYLLMEYLDGQPLGALLDHGPLDLRLAQRVLLQLCEALSAAHAAGVVHRDLKPDNVFLTRKQGEAHFVKVMDFGIAKLREGSGTALTAAGSILGTPEYMAPEQCAGAEVDGRADLYALGVIAYQLTTGRTPFTGRNLTQLLLAHQLDAPRPPGELRAGVPRRWEEAILRALAKRPEDRYPDVAAFGAALWAGLASASPLEAGAAPLQAQPRHRAELTAQVTWAGLVWDEALKLSDLSRGGAFVCWESSPPPLMARVELSLRPPEGEPLALAAEVVRHVSAADARAWGLPAGFAVQFVGLGPAQRARLAELIKALPLAPAPAQAAAPSRDPRVEEVLEYFRKRASAGHYEFLGVDPGSGKAAIEARVQRLRAGLAALPPERLGAADAEQARAALERLRTSAEVLLTPLKRLEYDALRGNHAGVARLLEEGLARQLVEAKRVAFLLERRDVEARVLVHQGRARLARGMRNLPAARAELEAALALDPLNLALHEAHQALARELASAAR